MNRSNDGEIEGLALSGVDNAEKLPSGTEIDPNDPVRNGKNEEKKKNSFLKNIR